MSEDLRLYAPDDVDPDGYPSAWHRDHWQDDVRYPPIKDAIRATAGDRCERCGHPYAGRKRDGRISQAGQWSPCGEHCTHGGPTRAWKISDGTDGAKAGDLLFLDAPTLTGVPPRGWTREAQWRVLTVHHLNGVKWDCRWWNLAALCQRCHLSIQGRVLMERVYPLEHSEWFKPHAAGWYAAAYLGEDLSRKETMERLDELLALEQMA